jgi:hypothetical protein
MNRPDPYCGSFNREGPDFQVGPIIDIAVLYGTAEAVPFPVP